MVMRRAIFSIGFPAVAGLVILSVCNCSCRRLEQPNLNNPVEQPLPAAKFAVTLCEEERGVVADSVYRFIATVSAPADDGKVTFTKKVSVNGAHGSGRTWDVTPDVVEVVLTPYNRISFEVDADVNASSSTDVMDIGKGADLRHYELKAVKDGSGIREGSSTIRFWNGKSEDGNAITIRVRAANSVPVEGFEVRFDGRLFSLVPKDFRYTLNSINVHDCTIGELPNVAYPYEHFEETLIEIGEHTELMPFEELYDMSRVKEIEFVGTVPRNATPDNVIRQIYDPISYGQTTVWRASHQPYDWNLAKYEEFRWAPFHEECRKFTSTVIDGRAKFDICPADLRYLKAQIWNTIKASDSNTDNGRNFYFYYETLNGGSSTYWWGCIVNEPGK